MLQLNLQPPLTVFQIVPHLQRYTKIAYICDNKCKDHKVSLRKSALNEQSYA